LTHRRKAKQYYWAATFQQITPIFILLNSINPDSERHAAARMQGLFMMFLPKVHFNTLDSKI
jgi:hypothetical protein